MKRIFLLIGLLLTAATAFATVQTKTTQDRLIFKDPNPTGTAGILNLDDAPDANDLYVLRTISMDDSFIDYVRFNPAPSGGGIFVTLAKITWDVSASVTYANTNITQNSDKGPHGPTDSDEFPTWTTIK